MSKRQEQLYAQQHYPYFKIVLLDFTLFGEEGGHRMLVIAAVCIGRAAVDHLIG